MTSILIELMFTCKVCGIEKRKVKFRRRRKGEDIKTFLEECAAQCGLTHEILAPKCPCRVVDLYIPADDEKGIGF